MWHRVEAEDSESLSVNVSLMHSMTYADLVANAVRQLLWRRPEFRAGVGAQGFQHSKADWVSRDESSKAPASLSNKVTIMGAAMSIIKQCGHIGDQHIVPMCLQLPHVFESAGAAEEDETMEELGEDEKGEKMYCALPGSPSDWGYRGGGSRWRVVLDLDTTFSPKSCGFKPPKCTTQWWNSAWSFEPLSGGFWFSKNLLAEAVILPAKDTKDKAVGEADLDFLRYVEIHVAIGSQDLESLSVVTLECRNKGLFDVLQKVITMVGWKVYERRLSTARRMRYTPAKGSYYSDSEKLVCQALMYAGFLTMSEVAYRHGEWVAL